MNRIFLHCAAVTLLGSALSASVLTSTDGTVVLDNPLPTEVRGGSSGGAMADADAFADGVGVSIVSPSYAHDKVDHLDKSKLILKHSAAAKASGVPVFEHVISQADASTEDLRVARSLEDDLGAAAVVEVIPAPIPVVHNRVRFVVRGHYNNGSSLTELNAFSSDSTITPITVSAESICGSQWSSVWSRSNLTDGDLKYTSNSEGASSTWIINYRCDAINGTSSFFVDSAVGMSSLRLWIGGPEMRTPRQITVFDEGGNILWDNFPVNTSVVAPVTIPL